MTATALPVVEITEAVWHRDRNATGVMAWRNDMAGETFTLPTVGTYVRINDRHVRIDAELGRVVS